MNEGVPLPEARPLVDGSPRQLAREAISLALILMAVLTISLLEQREIVPWQGYVSSSVLLVLGWLHKLRFGVVVRLLPGRRRGWVFPVAFSITLAAANLAAACLPAWPSPDYLPPFFQSVHLLLLAPLCEEFYFRGLLLGHLRRGFSPIQAALLCSLLFALLHSPADAMATAGILSLAACALAIRSGALGYALQLHVAWNGFSMICRLDDPASRWTLAACAAATVCAIGFAWIIIPHRGKR